MRIDHAKLLSTTSHKAKLAGEFGYLNGIHYMAPAAVAGAGNLCPDASEACKSICLGEHAGMVSVYSSVMQSRINKARTFMRDRKSYIAGLRKALALLQRQAAKQGLVPVARLNGSTDVNWIALHDGNRIPLVREFSDLQFVEYTKSLQRMLAYCRGELPSNVHLTFSFSGDNWHACQQVLAAGGNVAVCFGCDIPADFCGFETIDGDASDLRHLDPDMRGNGCGKIVALKPKGSKAKKDTSGFVVWRAEAMARAA